MASLTKIFTFSVGKKLIMGLTGFFLITFLIEHLIGNLLMLGGPTPFNEYAEFMGHTWYIRIAEVVLFAGFIIHIYDGLSLAMQNNKARPVKYAVKGKGKTSTWASRNMKWTGVILLVFLILHLLSFFMDARFGVDIGIGVDTASFPYQSATIGEEASLWHKAAAQFAVEWYSAIYVIAMIIVGIHLVHGFQSAFQTLGIKYPKYAGIIEKTGLAFAILVPAGLAAIPVYFVILKHTGDLAAYYSSASGFGF